MLQVLLDYDQSYFSPFINTQTQTVKQSGAGRHLTPNKKLIRDAIFLGFAPIKYSQFGQFRLVISELFTLLFLNFLGAI